MKRLSGSTRFIPIRKATTSRNGSWTAQAKRLLKNCSTTWAFPLTASKAMRKMTSIPYQSTCLTLPATSSCVKRVIGRQSCQRDHKTWPSWATLPNRQLATRSLPRNTRFGPRWKPSTHSLTLIAAFLKSLIPSLTFAKSCGHCTT